MEGGRMSEWVSVSLCYINNDETYIFSIIKIYTWEIIHVKLCQTIFGRRIVQLWNNDDNDNDNNNSNNYERIVTLNFNEDDNKLTIPTSNDWIGFDRINKVAPMKVYWQWQQTI